MGILFSTCLLFLKSYTTDFSFSPLSTGSFPLARGSGISHFKITLTRFLILLHPSYNPGTFPEELSINGGLHFLAFHSTQANLPTATIIMSPEELLLSPPRNSSFLNSLCIFSLCLFGLSAAPETADLFFFLAAPRSMWDVGS